MARPGCVSDGRRMITACFVSIGKSNGLFHRPQHGVSPHAPRQRLASPVGSRQATAPRRRARTGRVAGDGQPALLGLLGGTAAIYSGGGLVLGDGWPAWGLGGASSVSRGRGGDDFKRDFTGAKGRNTLPRRARRLWATLGWALATTGRGNRRWNGGQLAVAQDAGHRRLLGDGGNDAQGATAAQRTGCHIQSKHATQQFGPVPIRGSRLRFIAVATLLAR